MRLPRGQGFVYDLAAHHFAEGGFRGVPHGPVGVPDLEKILGRIGDQELDDQVDVHDVFISGQHQGFLRPVRIARGRPRIDGAEADLHALHLGHFRREDGFDGIGQVVIQARISDGAQHSESKDDALLVRSYGVDSGGEPDEDGDNDYVRKSPLAKIGDFDVRHLELLSRSPP